ncbi:hypothetical protein WJU23_15995 [Prosthecobacter sp. SYSU 5D2]|uniref:hypothetical protein n=1 Tax=Prosthecobacter sp. SYSU 5D2 TaxID=3134134 RepID=UPI0031FEA2BF
MEANPYAPPQSDISIAVSAEETLRRDHLSAEGAIKSVGILLILGGLVTLSAGSSAPAEVIQIGLLNVPAAFLIIVGAVQTGIGLGIRLLKPWSRIPGILICALGLLNFPVGTVFCALFIYYLANKRGTFVLSPEYKAVVAATPQVKRKTSILLIVFLLLLPVIFGWMIYSMANE